MAVEDFDSSYGAVDETPTDPVALSQQLADAIAVSHDTDVLFYNGGIDIGVAREFTRLVNNRQRRSNVLLILVTMGGDPGAAYRIARLLQTKYANFALCVPSVCKSSGTLLATGAHQLVISDQGELGPLDIQMQKRDELIAMQSGLTILDTLETLQARALSACEVFFLTLSLKSGGDISLKTAMDVATAMTTGLFTPLYSQVDPLLLGEAGRAMSIGSAYGQRLLRYGKNILPAELQKLITDYPYHGFVIDRQEASELFQAVREPSEVELRLLEILESQGILETPEQQLAEAQRILFFLSTQPDDLELTDTEGEDNEGHDEEDNEEAEGATPLDDGTRAFRADHDVGDRPEPSPEEGRGPHDPETSQHTAPPNIEEVAAGSTGT